MCVCVRGSRSVERERKGRERCKTGPVASRENERVGRNEGCDTIAVVLCFVAFCSVCSRLCRSLYRGTTGLLWICKKAGDKWSRRVWVCIFCFFPFIFIISLYFFLVHFGLQSLEVVPRFVFVAVFAY